MTLLQCQTAIYPTPERMPKFVCEMGEQIRVNTSHMCLPVAIREKLRCIRGYDESGSLAKGCRHVLAGAAH